MDTLVDVVDLELDPSYDFVLTPVVATPASPSPLDLK